MQDEGIGINILDGRSVDSIVAELIGYVVMKAAMDRLEGLKEDKVRELFEIELILNDLCGKA